MSDRVSVDAVLASIRSNRTQIENLWTGLTPSEMTARPGPQEDWSVKDLIAHLTWWEQRCVRVVDAYMNGRDYHDNWSNIDMVNAQVFEENQDRSLEDILDEFEASLPIVEAQILSLDEDTLNRAIDDTNYVYNFYEWDCYGHYPDHLEDMQRYAASLE